jgi:putative methyltransferase (TIGR04325 family)
VIWEGIFSKFPTGGGNVAFSSKRWIERQKLEAEELMRNPSAPSSGGSVLADILPGWIAARGTATKIVDFGGGLALEYLRTKGRGVPVDQFAYTVVETEPVCRAGREVFRKTSGVAFASKLAACRGPIDIFHAASSLHYVRDWKSFLRRVADLGPELLVLAGTLAGAVPTFASLQNYYGTTIPVWFLNQGELFARLGELGFKCISDQPAAARYFGRVRPLPMQNFPSSHRLRRKRNFIFCRADESRAPA